MKKRNKIIIDSSCYLDRCKKKKVLSKKITFKFLRHHQGSCEAYFSRHHSSMTSMVWNPQIHKFGGPLSYTRVSCFHSLLQWSFFTTTLPHIPLQRTACSQQQHEFSLCHLSDGRWTRQMKMHWYCLWNSTTEPSIIGISLKDRVDTAGEFVKIFEISGMWSANSAGIRLQELGPSQNTVQSDLCIDLSVAHFFVLAATNRSIKYIYLFDLEIICVSGGIRSRPLLLHLLSSMANTGNFLEHWKFDWEFYLFFLLIITIISHVGCWCTGTGCPRGLWMPHPWRHSRPGWTWLWAAWSGGWWPCT